jgi:membrane-bound ClpP family serine protease
MGNNAIFKFIARGVPAIAVLGGILLLFLGYPFDNRSLILGGWALVTLGAIIYGIETFASKQDTS